MHFSNLKFVRMISKSIMSYSDSQAPNLVLVFFSLAAVAGTMTTSTRRSLRDGWKGASCQNFM